MIERMKNENRIDVFRTVKDLRDYRPNMIDSVVSIEKKLCTESKTQELTPYLLNFYTKDGLTMENIAV